MWTDVLTCNILFHIRCYFYYHWNGPLLPVSFLWTMKQLKSPGESIQQIKQIHMGSRKMLYLPSERKALTLWIKYFMLENEAISWTFLLQKQQHKIKQQNQQWLSFSSRYFSWNIFVLTKKSIFCHRSFSEKDQTNSHLKFLRRLERIPKQIQYC